MRQLNLKKCKWNCRKNPENEKPQAEGGAWKSYIIYEAGNSYDINCYILIYTIYSWEIVY